MSGLPDHEIEVEISMQRGLAGLQHFEVEAPEKWELSLIILHCGFSRMGAIV